MQRIFLAFFICWLWSQPGFVRLVRGQFEDKSSDLQALPNVPAEFDVTLFASEPLVRQPCSMAFDERGRLFVGMGPQYRNPTPDTAGDSVVIVQDTDGNGRADRVVEFARGFNAIQGLAWHGCDLWVANAPDLTVVKDRGGDYVADEYVRVYTDLGNLEHGLHGLTWAPDGKLYMSKGNSKGLNQSGRYAPKPFRDLWGVTAPADVPDFPSPVAFNKDNYRRTYHDPADDWGLDGGILRCDDSGHNLEIVARGFRNPWDIAIDGGFNWLGTDNDQVSGDRVIMPFYGSHFGWNHPWSSHWGIEPHAPTAPVSGPLFEGSGTGIVFCQSPQFPPSYRGAFLVNDWLQKTTYLWRTEWDGALMRPVGGGFTPFIEGGSSLFRPTDMEFGPDGALWVLGWSSGYGAEWLDGQLTNEGRIYRVAWKDAKPADQVDRVKRLDELSVDELIDEFDSTLPVRRINAQDALVQRGTDDSQLHAQLVQRLTEGMLTENQETWTIWALGRMPSAASLAEFLLRTLQTDSKTSLNLRVQSIRILAYRATQFAQETQLTEGLLLAFGHVEPRVRFAAFQAVQGTRQSIRIPMLLTAIKNESDSTAFYAGWQALHKLSTATELRELLSDSHAAVRRAALLGLLETGAAIDEEIHALAEQDNDSEVREIARLWLSKSHTSTPKIAGRSLQAASAQAVAEAAPLAAPPAGFATIRGTQVKNGAAYRVVPGGFRKDATAYVDRSYRLTNVPAELEGADLIQTANNDDNSQGKPWLTAEALVPVRVWVGIDARQATAPRWLIDNFQKESLTTALDEGATFEFYSRSFETGHFELGGNTNDGRSGGKGNYIVAITPQPLAKRKTKTTIDAVETLLDRGDRDRGELLFRHTLGASCAKCHSVDQAINGFGPDLSSIGLRSNARHIVQSILEPSAVITEGFNQLMVLTDDGRVYSGVLLEESGLGLSLGQTNGSRVDIPKNTIEERKSTQFSAMPDLSELLSPQQVADLTAYLRSMQAEPKISSLNPPASYKINSARKGFGVEQQSDRLKISLNGQQIVDFVFRDEAILRPYFANARTTHGVQVTRNQPPIPGEDALDHDTMHPGIWLAFGDISGHDFWRNKAAMEHVRFVTPPTLKDGQLKFATECVLKSNQGDPLCQLTNEFTLSARPSGWMLSWTANFRADQRNVVFGDQEEMGFGARVATGLSEKEGGLIRSSSGKQSAKETWGQLATWCDYASNGSQAGGIMLMASDKNFRESWWHNRDYGVFVANPFGREAMKQGPKSSVDIPQGQTLQLRFGALLHDGQELDLPGEYKFFIENQLVAGR